MPSALFVTTVDITLEAFLLPLAEHLKDTGWRVDALASGASGNTKVTAVFSRTHDIDWRRSPIHPANLTSAATRVKRVVTTGNYDVVHVHTPVAAFVTRFALRSIAPKSRPTIIYTAHGFHFYPGGNRAANRAYYAFERAAARWTDFLVTINAEDFDAARAFGTIDVERVRFIPGIGVDCDLYAPPPGDADPRTRMREHLGIPSETFLVTMVAEMAPVKRHAMLLAALARTKNPNLRVLFVGQGPLEAELREKAQALGLSHRVHFAGYRRDVPQILAASDALALVSEREGLARSVLEAMACGLPVIATDTRGITDAVGDTGWITPHDDVGALAGALDDAANDPPHAQALGASARARACAEFSLARVIDEHDSLYAEALDSRRSLN